MTGSVPVLAALDWRGCQHCGRRGPAAVGAAGRGVVGAEGAVAAVAGVEGRGVLRPARSPGAFCMLS